MTHIPDDQLVLFISEALEPRARDHVQAHLGVCAECRASAEELVGIHTELRALKPEAVPSQLAMRALARHATVRSSWTSRRWVLSAAAGVLFTIGAASGAIVMQWRASRVSTPASATADAGGRYLILFYERMDLRAAQTADDRRERYRRFAEWQRPLVERQLLIGGLKLRDEDGRLYSGDGTIYVRDTAATSELGLTGYLSIRASSYDEAASFVKNCPIFDDGGRVEVRRVS